MSGELSDRMDIPIQVLHIVKVMRKDFNDNRMMQVTITENPLGTRQMMKEVSDHVRMNYAEIPDPTYVAQPDDDFLFFWEEEMGSAENPITIDEDEGFSELMRPRNTPQQQTAAKEFRPALRSTRKPPAAL